MTPSPRTQQSMSTTQPQSVVCLRFTDPRELASLLPASKGGLHLTPYSGLYVWPTPPYLLTLRRSRIAIACYKRRTHSSLYLPGNRLAPRLTDSPTSSSRCIP